jgi:hypothetical protein
MKKVLALVVLVGLLGMSATALAQTPAQDQYGNEPPAAGTDNEPNEPPAAGTDNEPSVPGTSTESTQVSPGVFTPPGAQTSDDGLLPFTGAALIVPAALGAAMLSVGLFAVYRTRRRGD